MCGLAAYYFSLADGPSEGRAQSINEARGWAVATLALGLSWFFLFPILDSFDTSMEPYADIAFKLTHDTDLDISEQNNSGWRTVGYLLWIIAMLMPILVSIGISLAITTLLLYGSGILLHSTYTIGENRNEIKPIKLRWFLIFHITLPVVYLIGYY